MYIRTYTYAYVFDSLLCVWLDTRYFTYKASLNLIAITWGRYYILIFTEEESEAQRS